MSITAIVENDLIKLPVHIPNGTRVEITPLPAAQGMHHDLDHLIGSWQEDPGFDAAMKVFSQAHVEGLRVC